MYVLLYHHNLLISPFPFPPSLPPSLSLDRNLSIMAELCVVELFLKTIEEHLEVSSWGQTKNQNI